MTKTNSLSDLQNVAEAMGDVFERFSKLPKAYQRKTIDLIKAKLEDVKKERPTFLDAFIREFELIYESS